MDDTVDSKKASGVSFPMDDLTEGVGESSSPPRSSGGYNVSTDEKESSGHKETVSNLEFREELDAHIPASSGLDDNVDRPKDPEKRPVLDVPLSESVCTKADTAGGNQRVDTSLEQALKPSDKSRSLQMLEKKLSSFRCKFCCDGLPRSVRRERVDIRKIKPSAWLKNHEKECKVSINYVSLLEICYPSTFVGR